MNRILYTLVLVLGFAGVLTAQNNYTQTNFRTELTTYGDISATGTAIAMTDKTAGSSTTPQEIGFSFSFNGTAFTRFMIHADGIMRLGTDAPGAATVIAANPGLANGAVFTNTTAAFQNIIMPFFTNLIQGVAIPEFHVLTTGTAPNRVCTIQWKNLADADNAGTAAHQFSNLEFQVKLYETTNDIEFVYGTFSPSAATVTGRNAVSGIKAASNSFFGLYRVNSFMPYQKTVVFNPTNHGRLPASYPFRNSVVPPTGFSNRFFGRIASDLNVGKVYFDSIAPLGSQTAGRLEALVVNEGTSAMNNISVSLNITGSNTHSDAVNIASLAAGASQRITFAAFNLANKGQQDVLVTITAAGDERSANNQLTVKQVISQSHNQTLDLSTSSTLGVGFTSANNISAIKMYGSGTRKIKQLRIPFGSYRNIVNVRIYEDGGAGGSPSGAALFTSANFFTTTEHIITVPLGDGVTVTGDYFIAVQQTTATNMVWRIFLNTPKRNDRYFNSSNNGVSWGLDATDPPWELMAEAYEESQGPDIGIERQTAPGCDYSTATDVKVTLRNFSANPIDFGTSPTTISGRMLSPAGTEFPFTIQKNSGVLPAGAFEEVTVLSNYDFSNRGFHRINARTNLAGDAETGNDSLSFFINNSIAVTRSVPDPICPLTTVTLTGPSFLANLQWTVDGIPSSGTTRVLTPIKTTVVKITGTDYRNCLLQDSVILNVKGDGLPPRPTLIFGDTILSHRNEFKDTVRVQKLAGHTIQWLGGLGTPVSDSALVLNQIAGMQNAKIAAAYTRIADGCSNLSDTLNYSYAPGVLHNTNVALVTCDSSYYDFNGPTGATGNNITRTFTPSTPGTKMKLAIYRLELAQFASLEIYDGPTSIGNRIVALSNAQNGNTLREFISSHETGAITVKFSVGSGTSQGWWAGLTCHTPEVYRTIVSGNWESASTWERKAPGGNYQPAKRPPSKGDDTVYIRHLVTLISSTPMDQVVVEEGATFGIENPFVNFISMPVYKTVEQPEILVKGILNISPRVQIFGANGQMIVPGRLNNFGQIDLDSVVFNGTAPQTLGNFSGASGSMKRLHINNPAGLTMGSDQDVTGFRFVNGIINTNSETIIKLNGSADAANMGHDGSHINGPLIIELSGGNGNRLFPIGKNGKYRPVLLDNSNSSGESSDRFTAEVIEGAPPARTLPDGINKVSELRFYRITRNGNSGTDFRVTLPYLGDDGVNDPANLTILKDNGAGAWLNIGGTVSGPVPGIIQSDKFNGFSDFVLANKTGGSNPLPVNWVSFTAMRVQADAKLEWQTARERSCNNYGVERSSDGINFREIGNEVCRNSQAQQTYRYLDLSPGKGTFYYRLRQVDTDGKFEYSPVRKVSFGEESGFLVYPNPARGQLQIANISTNADIRLYDVSGRMVMQLRSGQPFTTLQIGHLPSGIYELLITASDGERTVRKVQIIQ
jgi:hypothetical protein